MDITYKTVGVCSKEIYITTDNGIVKSVGFKSGCDGNLQGLSKLVEGMPVEEVIKKLSGIKCSGKNTSCPDQLAIAIERALSAAKEENEQEIKEKSER